MTISHIDNFKSTSSPGPGEDVQRGLVSEPVQADVDFFSAAVRPDDTSVTSNLPSQVASAIAGRLDETDKLSQQVLRTVKKVPGTEGGLEIVEMGRALSQCSLQMALTTKVVSKSVQALDKLTNLQ